MIFEDIANLFTYHWTDDGIIQVQLTQKESVSCLNECLSAA